MNRRDFIPRSAATVAGLMLAGKVLGQDNKCTAPCNPSPTWRTNSTIQHYHDLVLPDLMKVKQTRKVSALSAEEWANLGHSHLALGDAHSRVGNLHVTDLWIQANQPALVKKYGQKEVDRFLKLGTHQIWTEHAAAFAKVGESVHWSPEACANLGVLAVDAAVLAGFSAVLGLEGWAIFFGVADVTIAVMHYEFCE